jgi:aryl-alcohol dehydrogenase-like predicted oxidoreductase
MMGLCADQGIGVLPWSPLARGRLGRPWNAESTKRLETDKFGSTMYGKTEEADHAVIDRLTAVAAKRGVPQAQVALAWVMSNPLVTSPIIGASKPGHLEDAVAAVALKLTPEETAFLEELYIPHPTLGF